MGRRQAEYADAIAAGLPRKARRLPDAYCAPGRCGE